MIARAGTWDIEKSNTFSRPTQFHLGSVGKKKKARLESKNSISSMNDSDESSQITTIILTWAPSLFHSASQTLNKQFLWDYSFASIEQHQTMCLHVGRDFKIFSSWSFFMNDLALASFPTSYRIEKVICIMHETPKSLAADDTINLASY